MSLSDSSLLICPHCRSPLHQAVERYYCDNGHAFDKGRAGDVNLLLPQQKNSKSPGDSKAMVTARRDFLATGVYQPIAEHLANTVIRLTAGEPTVIADAGCGEGYYLRQIQRLAYPNSAYFCRNGGAFIAWDIAKAAVQSAAKQSKHMHDFSATWMTASNAAIPIADKQVGILISAFGFEVADEFARILRTDSAIGQGRGQSRAQSRGQGGYVITLDAGEQHLLALRQRIYPTIKPYREKPLLPQQQFDCLKQTSIRYQITLKQQQIGQLMLMTPHFYRATDAGKSAVAQLSELSLQVDVLLRIYRNKSLK